MCDCYKIYWCHTVVGGSGRRGHWWLPNRKADAPLMPFYCDPFNPCKVLFLPPEREGTLKKKAKYPKRKEKEGGPVVTQIPLPTCPAS